MASILLPGEEIDPNVLPTSNKPTKALSIGPGLTYTPPSTIRSSAAGTLSIDYRKHTAWMNTTGSGRYIPAVGDLIIATIHHSGADVYQCALAPHGPLVTLGLLAFENVSRKTRPVLHTGSLVYSRVSSTHRDLGPEIECVHPSSGKAEGMGELKGGTTFDVSLGMARRLMKPQPNDEGRITLLNELGDRGIPFELAVGRNGKVWIHSGATNTTLLIGRALQDIDAKSLTPAEQGKVTKALAKRLQS